jgi:transglutaminase-like putative cysteine protease
MVTRLRALLVPLCLAGLLVLAGAALGRIYSDDTLVRLVAGAAAGSVAVGVATRRLPSWTAAPVSAVLLAGYTVLALHLAASAGLTAAVLRDALANGIPRLLTAMIPVESTPDTVVVPVVATWLTGLAAVEVGFRSRRVLLGCLPPALLYAGALYVVGPNASAATATTLAFAGLAMVALVAGDPASPAASALPAKARAQALGAAGAGLVALLGVVAVAGPWVGGQVSAVPVDPRRYVEPPRVDSLDESPLNRISGWALAPEQSLLEFRPGPGVAASAAPGASSGDPSASSGDPGAVSAAVRLRLAVLSDYDGVTWRVGAVYRNAGRVLPEQPPLPGATVTEAQQDITVTGLTGRLLPAIPAPAGVSGARVAYDPGTGTLIRPEGLTSGLRYTVTSRVQAPDLNLLPIADSPSGDPVIRYLTVGPGVPDQVQRLAEHLADGNGGAYDRAVAIEEFLAEHYKVVADAPSGHAYPNIAHFLFGPAPQGGRVGTSEQFAAAYALLARLTGLPSRVVVGFTAPAAGGPVTGGDALAWPEVLFDGLGWVAFDPMPKSDEPRPVEEDFVPKPTTPPPTPSAPPVTSEAASTEPSAAALPAAKGDGPSRVVVAGGASGTVVVAGVIAGLSVVQMRRSQRRRRLFTGVPKDRVAGAWLELSDALRLAGRPLPAHLSATEAAGFAGVAPPPSRRTGLLRRAVPVSGEPGGAPARQEAPHEGLLAVGAPTGVRSGASAAAIAVGESGVEWPSAAEAPHSGSAAPGPLPPLDGLVAAVNTAGFAPDAVSSDQAAQAAAEVIAYSTALRRSRSRLARLWWSIRPGPLRWNR